ncbi:MAG: 23S rRNA (pseudouridine(1915)-N(3))-methyltransferase RlmH, partial [Acidobacteriota bacterium]
MEIGPAGPCSQGLNRRTLDRLSAWQRDLRQLIGRLMRIRVFWEGKTKNPHLRALVTEYTNRIAKFTDIVIEELAEAKKPKSKAAS